MSILKIEMSRFTFFVTGKKSIALLSFSFAFSNFSVYPREFKMFFWVRASIALYSKISIDFLILIPVIALGSVYSDNDIFRNFRTRRRARGAA